MAIDREGQKNYGLTLALRKLRGPCGGGGGRGAARPGHSRRPRRIGCTRHRRPRRAGFPAWEVGTVTAPTSELGREG